MTEHLITIRPSGHEVRARPGETVLEAALREGYGLPYGCRNGACGSCKGRVLEGTVEHGACEETALSADERARGYALFCRARPLTPLVIESREFAAASDLPVKIVPARVQELRRLAADVMLLRLKLPAAERLQFRAGQYVDILLGDGRRRSFSLANAPHDDELLELHIRSYPGGAFTARVFEGMKERDILRLQGPYGGFGLREDSALPAILLASGTGFAPVKGMLEHAFHCGLRRPFTLYWGCRVRADLYLRELPERWQREHANFRFVPVLSEPLPSDHWDGRRGLVHEAVMQDLPDLSGHEVYACGAPAMVQAAQRDFTRRCGLPEQAFFADAFTPATAPA